MNKLLLALLLISSTAYSAELQHSFNSPAFSGIGYSNHVLTIQQMEQQNVEKNKALADALAARAAAQAASTPEAKFLANLESRIYSQLAKQLTDSMFADGTKCTTPGTTCGTIPDLGGNTVTWGLGAGNDQGLIIINITSNLSPDQTTTMKVPAGTFYF